MSNEADVRQLYEDRIAELKDINAGLLGLLSKAMDALTRVREPVGVSSVKQIVPPEYNDPPD